MDRGGLDMNAENIDGNGVEMTCMHWVIMGVELYKRVRLKVNEDE